MTCSSVVLIRALLTASAVVIALLAGSASQAQAARFATAAEARSVFLGSSLGKECAAAEQRSDELTCNWTLPIMSTSTPDWGILSFSYVDSLGSVMFDVSGFIQRDGAEWASRGDLQDPCSASLPEGFAAELSLDCTESASATIPVLMAPKRLMGAYDTQHTRKGAETTLRSLRRWLSPQHPNQQQKQGRCTTTWKRAALVATTYGLAPCSGASRPLEITARRGWYTARGLTSGVPVSIARRLYPQARTYRGELTLVGELRDTGSIGPLLTTRILQGLSVAAIVSRGTVRGLRFENFVGE